MVLPHLLKTGYAYIKWCENRFHLQIGGRNLQPHPVFFAPNVGNVLTQEEAAGIGGIEGVFVGGFVAGPLGAILGGVASGLIGFLFGEPYHQTAQRMWVHFPQTTAIFERVANQVESDLNHARNLPLRRIV